MHQAAQSTHGTHEKTQVALVSLLAAVAMTTAKLLIGILTNSLGIISEALHSGLDLVATGMTLWAVRISDRPADADHHYGHGKYENLSALAQTLLLLVVCGWVMYEAFRRLFFGEELEITPSFWAYVIIFGSIGVDFWRARTLHRAAHKYQSQALEADALHFASDIWSSLVVLVGLVCVSASQAFNIPWLIHADAIAAFLVSLLVAVVCLRLGKRAVDALTDRSSDQLARQVASSAAAVQGVEGVRNVRVRHSGAGIFADMTVLVGRDLGLEQAHDVAEQVTSAVQAQLPRADVVVHVEPVARSDEDFVTSIRVLAQSLGLSVHDIRTYATSEGRRVELHAEVHSSLSLEQAHERVTELENQIKNGRPEITSILTHIEPEQQEREATVQPTADSQALQPYHEAIGEFGRMEGAELAGHDMLLRQTPQGVSLTFHLMLDGTLPIAEAHEISRRLERFLHRRFPQLTRITIHLEPRQANQGQISSRGSR